MTDQVHLGSCTKAMTATLIGTLVDQGLLSWSSTIRSVFPELASRIHPDFQAATLSHLLTHRAGLPHDASWWRLPGRTTTDKRRAALLELMGRAPATKPGTAYAYSNAGYVLAGLMAEQMSGRPWEDLIRTRVFEPLGMSSAGFGPPGLPDRDRGRIDQPWGHRDSGGRVDPVREDNAPCMGPAGTVHCTMADWGKFASLHLRAAEGKARHPQAGHVPGTPHAAAGPGIRRRLVRRRASVVGGTGAQPQRQQPHLVRLDLDRPGPRLRDPGRHQPGGRPRRRRGRGNDAGARPIRERRAAADQDEAVTGGRG